MEESSGQGQAVEALDAIFESAGWDGAAEADASWLGVLAAAYVAERAHAPSCRRRRGVVS